MTARPILFNAAMVRAVRNGRKTQTRRQIEPQPKHRLVDGLAHVTIGMDPSDDGAVWYDADGINPGHEVRAPYRPDDILWVRETWADGIGRPIYRADWGEPVGDNYPAHPDAKWLSELQRACGADVCKHEWRPSIHMPRWACREWLRVTDTRAERVQNISFSDCRAEGCDEAYSEQVDPCARCDGDDPCTGKHYGEKWHFSRLWDSTYGPGAWERNDWVWAYTFERVAKPEGWPKEPAGE